MLTYDNVSSCFRPSWMTAAVRWTARTGTSRRWSLRCRARTRRPARTPSCGAGPCHSVTGPCHSAAGPCHSVAGQCHSAVSATAPHCVLMLQRPSRTFHVSVHPPLTWDWCFTLGDCVMSLVQEATWVHSALTPARPAGRSSRSNNVSDYISTMNLDINIITSIKFVDAQSHYFGSCLDCLPCNCFKYKVWLLKISINCWKSKSNRLMWNLVAFWRCVVFL